MSSDEPKKATQVAILGEEYPDDEFTAVCIIN